jgi:imidazolonepropionase-like amidohydrolase
MHRTVLALLAISFSVAAADKTYVLKAAHMFDGKSDHVVSPGLVVVTNGKIAAVGAKAALPAGAETIDLGDATLRPDRRAHAPHLPLRARLP